VNLAAEAVVLPRTYVTSAVVFSITRAVFVGYLYRDFPLHLHDVALEGSWLFWAALFGAVFLFLSFVPKPRLAYCLNPITQTFLVWLLYYFGMNHAPLVQAHIKAVVSFSITSFGGPIWIMVLTWIWHFFVCLQMFGEESENA
jgi:hypothetical protein